VPDVSDANSKAAAAPDPETYEAKLHHHELSRCESG